MGGKKGQRKKPGEVGGMSCIFKLRGQGRVPWKASTRTAPKELSEPRGRWDVECSRQRKQQLGNMYWERAKHLREMTRRPTWLEQNKTFELYNRHLCDWNATFMDNFYKNYRFFFMRCYLSHLKMDISWKFSYVHSFNKCWLGT